MVSSLALIKFSVTICKNIHSTKQLDVGMLKTKRNYDENIAYRLRTWYYYSNSGLHLGGQKYGTVGNTKDNRQKLTRLHS